MGREIPGSSQRPGCRGKSENSEEDYVKRDELDLKKKMGVSDCLEMRLHHWQRLGVNSEKYVESQANKTTR